MRGQETFAPMKEEVVVLIPCAHVHYLPLSCILSAIKCVPVLYSVSRYWFLVMSVGAACVLTM